MRLDGAELRSGGHERWVAAVDVIKLGTVRPEKVQSWKLCFMRSADITTSRHYIAKKERVTVGLGHLLTQPTIAGHEQKDKGAIDTTSQEQKSA